MLDELEALDPAGRSTWSIGLVTPLQGVATSAHSIGLAAYLSRHFVLRGMDDEQEYRAFEREFKLISGEERQRLYTDRKAHKEIVLFLHEWGHTLGLIHHEERKLIMNPAYDPEQTEFSDYDRKIVALVVERRLAARDQQFPESADLLPLVTAMPAEEGAQGERAHLVDLVRRRVEHQSSRRDTRETGDAHDTVDLSAADIDAFNRAVSTVNAGRADGRLEAAGAHHRAHARAEGRRQHLAAHLRAGVRDGGAHTGRRGRGPGGEVRGGAEDSSPTSSRPGTGSRCRSTRRSWACRRSESRPTSPASTRPRS